MDEITNIFSHNDDYESTIDERGGGHRELPYVFGLENTPALPIGTVYPNWMVTSVSPRRYSTIGIYGVCASLDGLSPVPSGQTFQCMFSLNGYTPTLTHIEMIIAVGSNFISSISLNDVVISTLASCQKTNLTLHIEHWSPTSVRVYTKGSGIQCSSAPGTYTVFPVTFLPGLNTLSITTTWLKITALNIYDV